MVACPLTSAIRVCVFTIVCVFVNVALLHCAGTRHILTCSVLKQFFHMVDPRLKCIMNSKRKEHSKISEMQRDEITFLWKVVQFAQKRAASRRT